MVVQRVVVSCKQGYDNELKSEIECFSCVPLTSVWGSVLTLTQETITFAPTLLWEAAYWLLQVCYFSRRIRFSPGPVMGNTLMTNYINVKKHPSHTNTHTHRPLLSQCPEGRSFVCVYGFKCCWQVKINPLLLFSFLVHSLVCYFFLLLTSPSHYFPSLIQTCFPFCLFILSALCITALCFCTLQCHAFLLYMLHVFIPLWNSPLNLIHSVNFHEIRSPYLKKFTS